MYVSYRRVVVVVRVRFGTFPAFVVVLVMLIVDVQVFVFQFFVYMLQFQMVLRGPRQQRPDCRSSCYGAQYQKAHGQTDCTSEPTRERVCE